MKIEEATLQFIRDDEGRRNFCDHEEGDWCSFKTAEKLYIWLVECGYLTPDPLQEALDAVDKNAENEHYSDTTWVSSKKAKAIVRKLYEDVENKK